MVAFPSMISGVWMTVMTEFARLLVLPSLMHFSIPLWREGSLAPLRECSGWVYRSQNDITTPIYLFFSDLFFTESNEINYQIYLQQHELTH